jgi:hypothetical protein
MEMQLVGLLNIADDNFVDVEDDAIDETVASVGDETIIVEVVRL